MYKPNISVLDIAKTIGIIYLVYFLATKIPTMFDDYIDSEGIDETKIEQIADNVTRAVIATNNEDVQVLIEDLRKQDSVAIGAVEALGDKVTGIGKTVGKIGQRVDKQVEVEVFDDTVGSRDLHTFLVHSSLKTKDGGNMPIATVYYSPEIEDPNDRAVTDAHRIEFRANIIEAISKDGDPTRTVEAWAENSWSLESEGKKYPIDLYIEEWAIIKPPKSFMWNPNLALSVFAGIDDFFPGLSMSLWSYGHTKKDVDWRFASVFVGGTDDDVMVGVTPASYNLGNHLPLVSNLFIGPFVGSDFDGVIWGGGITIPF